MYGLKDKATEIIKDKYPNPNPSPRTQVGKHDGNRYQLIVINMDATH